MYNRNIMKKIAALAIGTFFLFMNTSCLKDDQYALHPSGGLNVIEFYNVTGPTSAYIDPVLVYSAGTFETGKDEFTFGVNYAGPENTAPQDIVVQLAASQQTVDKQNAAKGSGYTLVAADSYEMPTSLTIKKGEKFALGKVKLKLDKFDLAKKNVLAIAITSSSHGNISGNGGTAIFTMAIKNKYDGVYKVEALSPMLDVTAANLVGYYPLEANLVTILGNTNFMTSNTYLNGGTGHPIKNGTANSSYGNFSPIFKFDANNNVVEVTNYFGQGTNPNGRSARLDITGANKMTIGADGSKVMEVKYVMVENGKDRTFFHEKWTFLKSR